MFKIKADPTFDVSLALTGQGRKQTLNLTYRHMLRKEYLAMLESVSKGKKSASDAVLALVEKWDADAELNKQSVELLQEHQPGADWAIVTAYGEALSVEREKN